MARFLVLLILASSAMAEVPVIVDSGMYKSVDGYRGLTPREMREIRALAERSVAQARTWLREPKFQEYFQKHYGLDPVNWLDETGMTVKVMSLTEAARQWNKPRSGDYIEETRSIRLHVKEFIVAIRGQVQDQWVPVLATKIVHELVHAAAIDTNKHWEPKAGEPDEGTIAQKELEIFYDVAPEFMLELPTLLQELPPLVD